MTSTEFLRKLQVDSQGRLRHLVSTEGLPRDILVKILDTAEAFVPSAPMPGEQARGTGHVDDAADDDFRPPLSAKKVPLLRGKTIVNLFFEASTRTRTTFELAAKRLSADVLNIEAASSSTVKGETLLDTMRTLEAMGVNLFVIRHPTSGAAQYCAQVASPGVAVLNAGDGRHAHPTQGLLDVLALRQRRPDFENLRVSIVGDVLHSRVARSGIHALKTLGVPDIRVVGPATLAPKSFEALGVRVHHDLKPGIAGADVVMLLRLQQERMPGSLLPSGTAFFEQFGVTPKTLEWAAPEALIMHPGPINRGVEIAPELAYCDRSLVYSQVTHGLGIRMAVMSMILGHGAHSAGTGSVAGATA